MSDYHIVCRLARTGWKATPGFHPRTSGYRPEAA